MVEMVAGLKIATYNVGGLRDNLKRREIFNYLHEKDFHMVLLQERHCAGFLEKRWKTEWGGRAFFSNGTTQARGVMILISKQAKISVYKVDKD